ncbi:MAG: TerB family tellurite resistance protein [Ginsengibacter sp.]
MEQSTTILEGYSDAEKGAYLGAIASIATADRSASEEELEYIDTLCESADLPKEQTEVIINAASTQMTDDDLKRCLDVLKNSELKFSLVSDIIAFAESDQNYSAEEKQNVEKIAQYLGVNQEQFSVLNQFTKTAVQEAPKHAEAIETQQTTPHGFLESLGFGDKLKGAGINSSSLIKSALGIIGPMLLARMMSGRRGRSGGGGGLLGGLGGLFGGGGGIMPGNSGSSGGGLLGGLGSLMGGGNSGGLLGGLLGGGRGFGGAGGLLGRVLGGRR